MSGVREDLARGSLAIHHQTQHGVTRGGAGQKEDEGDSNGVDNIRMFRMTSPAKAGPMPCPVEGYSGRTATRKATRVNFWNWHIRDTVVILEEGKLTHPR